MNVLRALMCCAVLALRDPARAAVRPVATDERGDVETVELCKLASDYARYDQKRVRVAAILGVNPEERFLYDRACAGSENSVWLDRGQLDNAVVDRTTRRVLRRLLRRDGEAAVTVVGKFFGPRRYDPPAGTPPDVASLLARTNSRYGHLNSFRFRFEIEVIEESRPVPKQP